MKGYKLAISKAKLRLKIEYCGEDKELAETWDTRKWKEVSVDSYNEPNSRLTLIVCEGSPVKGFVIVNYGTKSVTAYDAKGNQIKTYKNLEWT